MPSTYLQPRRKSPTASTTVVGATAGGDEGSVMFIDRGCDLDLSRHSMREATFTASPHTS
jgi:hypothetical protein